MKQLTVVEVLEQGRAIIADKARWTKGAYRKNVYGQSTYKRNGDAVCWCSQGAVDEISDCTNPMVLNNAGDEAMQFLDKAVRKVFCDFPYPSIVCFNDADDTTHAAVLLVWDQAIADARAAQHPTQSA